MIDLLLRLFGQSGEGLEGPFHLIIFLKVFLSIFLGSQGVVQGDRHHLVAIVVQSLQLFGAGLQIVAVGVDELAVDTEFFPFLGVLELAELELIFLAVPLKSGVYNTPKIGSCLLYTSRCV